MFLGPLPLHIFLQSIVFQDRNTRKQIQPPHISYGLTGCVRCLAYQSQVTPFFSWNGHGRPQLSVSPLAINLERENILAERRRLFYEDR